MKVLIIKTGYSETLDGAVNETVSYGDVLRTTAILHLFKNDRVTWLTDYKAVPLLEGNEYIEHIMPVNTINLLQIESEHFDVVVNLEKVPGLCALAEKITAWKRYGFRFDFSNGKALAYEHADDVLALVGNIDAKRESKKSWVENLFAMMGKKWNGEEYILGYTPSTKIKYDIGFNHHVGPKWPNKKWSRWNELHSKLNKKYKISYQEYTDDLHAYIDWIASCKLIISPDSLGVHIALALGKKIICLFGPTVSNELHNARNLTKLVSPAKFGCVPCVKTKCNRKIKCMDLIKANQVEAAIKNFL